MRREERKRKERRQVRVPHDLQRFLVDVDRLMRAGDESTAVESDDLLQSECAYGGLAEEGSDFFGFTYLPEEGSRVKWELLLSSGEIAALASKETEQLSLWFCASAECRCAFTNAEET